MSARSGFQLDPTVADCGLVAELALNVYQSCKTSADDFQRMSDDMSSLYMTLRDIREDLTQDESGLSHTGADSLKEKLNSVHDALKCVEAELQKYDRLTLRSRERWEFLKEVWNNTGEAHTQIVSTTTSLRYLEKKMSMTSNTALEKLILKYLREVRDGLHEDSVMNLVPTDMPSKQQQWEDFKKELQKGVRVSPAVVDDHWDFICAVVRRAKETGDYDLDIPEGSGADLPPMEMENVERDLEIRAIDMDKLRKKGHHVDSKKTSPIVSLGLRALRLVSDERLIVAADEGDLERVKTLIHRRANVNASDKWRWTALHMAAYGGYNEIAKELIAAGADLTAMTVDGETPLKLAETNRHVDVVCTISDRVDELREQAARQTAR
ncbi:uncharacterized protein TRUGW13939_01698 [Talaromyces rugulosus]|uniref:Uncharacterized protein n=1 Tax=Talaromyces rugulosus TaxID=121627 RepID=A0A7H8QKZ8_TALRU|nr:uncharacterized protein TRUGW13939_01698 [Talaromyces rugulosus]QKX54610.1 hypothetical protein TRUGW13939_01698 [Talaromyces rugulosus]